MAYCMNDPTANAAIGKIDSEIREMAKEAEELRKKKLSGELTRWEEREARKRFTGIFRHLIEQALDE